MSKIILVMDSYKGCLGSEEVEYSVKEALLERFPECTVKCLPVADGGEGLLDTLRKVSGLRCVDVEVHDPLMHVRKSRYGILPDGETVVIEMAEAGGLSLLNEAERNPMRTTSFGTGELVLDALSRGYRKFLIGIGGSATNDAGMGMLEALGVSFYDKEGHKLVSSGEAMCRIARMDLSCMESTLSECMFKVACDVKSPFCGSEGAAYVFAAQKGATSEQVKALDEGMCRFADVIYEGLGKEVRNVAGAGAAGGLGGALYAFLNAELVSGADLILDMVGFDKELADADCVITGEGKSDMQTLMGKLPSKVLEKARRLNVPVILLSGKAENKESLLHAGFSEVVEVTPEETALDEAVKPEVAKENLRLAVCRLLLK